MVEWYEQKTVLYYSGGYMKNAVNDMRSYAKKFNEMGIKTRIYPSKCELVTDRVRVRFCSDSTDIKGMRFDDVFKVYNPDTAKRLRRNHSMKGFEGSLTDYVVLAHTMGTV